MWVTWRWQKNGEHGEEKKFALNPDESGYCFIAATYRSLLRFEELMEREPSLHPSVTPLSVYLADDLASIKLVTAIDIEKHMRRLAAQVHHLDPTRDLSLINQWASHSLRIGAVVVLHAMGFSPLDIQWLLRWKSTAFMAYLRNTTVLAERHYKALDKAAAMPHYV